MSMNNSKEYISIFSFGTVDVYRKGRKNCEVTLEMRLTEDNCFSVCGNLWNSRHTKLLQGGQCIDSLYNGFKELQQNKLYCEIRELWQKYHLNHLKAGTPEQEQAIKEWKTQGNKYDYSKACEYLKSINLYEVPLNGQIYKYGTGWLKEEIPDKDLTRIKELMGIQREQKLELENELEI